MNVVHCRDYDSVSVRAAALVIAEIEKKKDLLLCAATGSSPIGLYSELVRQAKAERDLFRELTIIQLDEWGGLGEDDPGSAQGYLKTRLLDPLGIPPERCISFAATASDPAAACRRMRAALAQRGPIDVAILGLGINGHIGFNEPGPFLKPRCHVASLSEETRRHAMVQSMDAKPDFGLTLGMQEILAARRIILLVTGAGKHHAVDRLLSEEVSTTLPASLLWLHPQVECLIDQTLLANHERRSGTGARDPSGR